MKIGLMILTFASGLLGVGGYVAYFRSATTPTQLMLSQPGGEMDWLRREFRLSDSQFAEVKQLHEEYAPRCDAMCARIAESNKRLSQLIAANRSMTSEIEAALKQCTQVQQDCREAMLGHVYAVGQKMPPEQGARYVQMMKMRIIEPALPHHAVISESAK